MSRWPGVGFGNCKNIQRGPRLHSKTTSCDTYDATVHGTYALLRLQNHILVLSIRVPGVIRRASYSSTCHDALLLFVYDIISRKNRARLCFQRRCWWSRRSELSWITSHTRRCIVCVCYSVLFLLLCADSTPCLPRVISYDMVHAKREGAHRLWTNGPNIVFAPVQINVQAQESPYHILYMYQV